MTAYEKLAAAFEMFVRTGNLKLLALVNSALARSAPASRSSWSLRWS